MKSDAVHEVLWQFYQNFPHLVKGDSIFFFLQTLEMDLSKGRCTKACSTNLSLPKEQMHRRKHFFPRLQKGFYIKHKHLSFSFFFFFFVYLFFTFYYFYFFIELSTRTMYIKHSAEKRYVPSTFNLLNNTPVRMTRSTSEDYRTTPQLVCTRLR